MYHSLDSCLRVLNDLRKFVPDLHHRLYRRTENDRNMKKMEKRIVSNYASNTNNKKLTLTVHRSMKQMDWQH